MRKYTDEEKKRYWHARCEECGWQGLSCDCDGFGPIGDTGDFDDGYCPKCESVVYAEDSPWPLKFRVLWLWRTVTFWAWRKRRADRLAEEAFVEQCRREWKI